MTFYHSNREVTETALFQFRVLINHRKNSFPWLSDWWGDKVVLIVHRQCCHHLVLWSVQWSSLIQPHPCGRSCRRWLSGLPLCRTLGCWRSRVCRELSLDPFTAVSGQPLTIKYTFEICYLSRLSASTKPTAKKVIRKHLRSILETSLLWCNVPACRFTPMYLVSTMIYDFLLFWEYKNHM